MRRLLTSAAAVGLTVVLVACGSDNSATQATTSSGSPDTVSVANIDGLGPVLVDSSGKALYVSDEEAAGVVLCVDACTSFWKPLEAGAAPTAAVGTTAIGMIDRPDGTKQVTANGRPLYTFTEDPPGKVTGDGFADDFGSQHFTWHAVVANGTTAATSGGGSTPATTTAGGYGY
jgi:predicted lipoprotein with Yx(FWY)xxD motif